MFHLTTFGAESSSKVLARKKNPKTNQKINFKLEFKFVMHHWAIFDIKSSSEAFVGKEKGTFETYKLWKK